MPDDQLDTVIRIRVTEDMADRYNRAIMAKKLRNGGQASVSDEGRQALAKWLEALEAEYAEEIQTVTAARAANDR